MSSDELWDIFHEELDGDILAAERFAADRDYSSLKEFAHRYKVRLEYLGFTDAYELCLDMEASFAAADYSTLMEHAATLLIELRSISKRVG